MENIQQFDPENPTREFTGVWIPAEIILDENLTAIERIAYAEIASFREFYASNAWLANRLGKSEPTARRIIASLIDKGYIERAGFNGRFRKLRAGRPLRNEQGAQNRAGRVIKNEQADRSEMSTIEQSKEQSKESSKEEAQGAADDQQKKSESYGNADINRLLKLFETETGIATANTQQNRRALYSLIRSRGSEGAESAVRLAGTAMRSDDQFAPRIASPRDLVGKYEKFSALQAWSIKRAKANKPAAIPGYKRYEPEDPEDYTPVSKERIAELRAIAFRHRNQQ